MRLIKLILCCRYCEKQILILEITQFLLIKLHYESIGKKVLEFRFRDLWATTSTDAYSEPCQTSKMGHFAEMVNDWKLLRNFAKRSILDIWQGSEFASAINLWDLSVSEKISDQKVLEIWQFLLCYIKVRAWTVSNY